MNKKISTLGLAIIAGTSMTAMQALPAMAAANDAEAPAAERTETTVEGMQQVKLDKVEGVFTFNQDELSSLDEIVATLGRASKFLCGSQTTADIQALGEATVTNILVKGAVNQEIAVNLEDSKDNAIKIVMGCSCAGNLAGGRATANAEITGIKIADIMKLAGVSEEANTIVFTSADGFEVAMPLSYVQQRHSVIVTAYNGTPIGEAIGSANQLWLGSTPARYFAKDITAISFEVRQTPPPAPYTDEGVDYYANFPGVGVSSAVA